VEAGCGTDADFEVCLASPPGLADNSLGLVENSPGLAENSLGLTENSYGRDVGFDIHLSTPTPETPSLM
jgi:hypothetical protein